MLRLLKHVHGIADHILRHRENEVQHDGRLLTVLETTKMKNLSLNSDKIQFKSSDCKLFGYRLTPECLKPDPVQHPPRSVPVAMQSEKVIAIVQMKALQSYSQS